MTPNEVLEFAKKHDVKFVDLKFIDLPGIWQHTTVPIQQLKEDSSRTASGSTARRSAAGSRSTPPTCCSSPTPTTARIDPFTQYPTLSLICNVVRSDHEGAVLARSAQHRAKAEKYLKSTGIADVCYFGPEAEFFVFDDVRYDSQPNQAFYFLDSVEGRWNTGREEFPNLGYKPRTRAATSRSRRPTRSPTCAPRWCTTMQDERHRGRDAAPRGRDRRPVRDRHELQAAARDGRQAHVVQVHRQERRAPQRQDGDVHAEAALRRQRHGHALPPVALEGRQAALRRRRLRGPVGDGALLHRRHHQARQVDLRRSPTRRRTRTAGWRRASRRR